MSNDFEQICRATRHLTGSHRNKPSISSLSLALGLTKQECRNLLVRWSGSDPERFLKCLSSGQLKEMVSSAAPAATISTSTDNSAQLFLSDVHIDLLTTHKAQYNRQQHNIHIRFGFHSTHFGRCLVGMNKDRICWLSFVDNGDQHALNALVNKWPNATLSMEPLIGSEFICLFSPRYHMNETKQVPLLMTGTDFQIEVWRKLIHIPAGKVVTYQYIARELGRPNAARAIGNAIGSNPIAILVPCHRVITSAGTIGGYRWSAERKQSLLALECLRLK